MLDLRTVNSVFEHMSSRGDATVVLWNTGGAWKPITSKQMYGRVRALVEALQSWGVKPGDRVGLLSENRWEWAVADFAALAMGAVDVPLYQTLTPEQMGFMLKNAGVKVMIVSTKEQYEKVVAAGELPDLERVVVMDEGSFPNAESFAAIMKRAPELEEKDAAFDAMGERRAAGGAGDDHLHVGDDRRPERRDVDAQQSRQQHALFDRRTGYSRRRYLNLVPSAEPRDGTASGLCAVCA